MFAKKLIFLSLVSTMVAMGSTSREKRLFGFSVPDFVTQTVANGMKTAASIIPGLDADEGVRAGCQAVGFYNTPKATASKPSGISAGFGALTGAWGQAFASEESKKKVCQDNGFYDPNYVPQQNLPPVYVYDPPIYVPVYDEGYQDVAY